MEDFRCLQPLQWRCILTTFQNQERLQALPWCHRCVHWGGTRNLATQRKMKTDFGSNGFVVHDVLQYNIFFLCFLLSNYFRCVHAVKLFCSLWAKIFQIWKMRTLPQKFVFSFNVFETLKISILYLCSRLKNKLYLCLKYHVCKVFAANPLHTIRA